LTIADLGNATTVHREIGGDVVLSTSAKQLYGRDLCFTRCQRGLSSCESGCCNSILITTEMIAPIKPAQIANTKYIVPMIYCVKLSR
jgi:hypothetical protein